MYLSVTQISILVKNVFNKYFIEYISVILNTYLCIFYNTGIIFYFTLLLI